MYRWHEGNPKFELRNGVSWRNLAVARPRIVPLTLCHIKLNRLALELPQTSHPGGTSTVRPGPRSKGSGTTAPSTRSASLQKSDRPQEKSNPRLASDGDFSPSTVVTNRLRSTRCSLGYCSNVSEGIRKTISTVRGVYAKCSDRLSDVRVGLPDLCGGSVAVGQRLRPAYREGGQADHGSPEDKNEVAGQERLARSPRPSPAT